MDDVKVAINGVLVKLGRRRMVGGQEDTIVDVALGLARDSETVA